METQENSAQRGVKGSKYKVKVTRENRCGKKEVQDGKRLTVGSLVKKEKHREQVCEWKKERETFRLRRDIRDAGNLQAN